MESVCYEEPSRMEGLGSLMILAVIASVEDCLLLDFLFMRKK